MIAVDTSVLVAAFVAWHEAQPAARAALAEGPSVPVHVSLETYSVLTRLPHPHRLPGPIVADMLTRAFPPARRLHPSVDLLDELPERCAALGVEGGALYDALVAATAAERGAELVTRDGRAVPIYRLMGAAVRLID